MALRYLNGSVTQGSADAFAVAEITTGLSGLTRQALRLRELLVLWPSLNNIASQEVTLALSRVSLSAIATLATLGLFWLGQRREKFTTSGAMWEQKVERYTYTEDDEVLIVEDPIYLAIDSTSTALTNTATVRIGYEVVTISELERLNLRLDSLAAT